MSDPQAPSGVPGGDGGYELHQKLRTKTVRLLRKKKYDEAIATLYDGSLKLLDSHEQGSGADLALYLLDVYEQAGVRVDDTSRDRVCTLLDRTAADFWRKKVVGAAVKWACNASGTIVGDVKLRMTIANLFLKDKLYYEAEAQLLAAATADVGAAKQLGAVVAEWNHEYAEKVSKTDPNAPPLETVERVMAGSMVHRGWVPLLLAEAPQSADAFMKSYIGQIIERQPTLLLSTKPNPKDYKTPAPSADALKTSIYATANLDLNFAQTAVALAYDASKRPGKCPTPLQAAWQALGRSFANDGGFKGQEPLQEMLLKVSSVYFNINVPSNRNDMLSGMMANLFGGGESQQSPQGKAHAQIKQLPKPIDPDAASAQPAASSEADQLVDEEMD